MAVLTEDQETLYMLTADDVIQMAELGVFDDGPAVELLDGALIEKMAEGDPHMAVAVRLFNLMARGVDPRFLVTAGNGIAFERHSLPEPDIAVVLEAEVSKVSRVERAALVVEVSDSSLRKDRGRKSAIYARAAVPEYWIVNLKTMVVEIRTDPRPDSATWGSMCESTSPAVLQPITPGIPPVDLGALLAP